MTPVALIAQLDAEAANHANEICLVLRAIPPLCIYASDAARLRKLEAATSKGLGDPLGFIALTVSHGVLTAKPLPTASGEATRILNAVADGFEVSEALVVKWEDQVELMANIVHDIEHELRPDTKIVLIDKKGPHSLFKPHEFRSAEHLAEALTEPDPQLVEEVRAARRNVPDELVIALYDDDGSLLLVTKKR